MDIFWNNTLKSSVCVLIEFIRSASEGFFLLFSKISFCFNIKINVFIFLQNGAVYF